MFTCYNSSGAVLLRVAVLEADGARVGFSLVRTQCLPLLLQAILILQVIFHVGLEEKSRVNRVGESGLYFPIRDRFIYMKLAVVYSL